MTSLKNTLNAYNNGKLTPNCNNGGNMFAKNNYTDISTTNSISNATTLSIFPKPVSNTTTIYFSLSQSQKVSLKIFDVNGRLVTTLANEEMQAGVHEIKWNANNASGKPVSSGLYLLRIEAGYFKETKKIFLVK